MKKVALVIFFMALAVIVPTSVTAESYSTLVFSDSPVAYWRLGEISSATVAVDSSSSGLDGQYYNPVTPGVPGALTTSSNTAARFTGDGFNGGCVDVGFQSLLNLSNDFSIEAWFKTDAISGVQRIVSNRYYTASSKSGYGFGIEDSHLIFSAFAIQDYRTSDFILPNRWYHVVAVLDSSNDAIFYVDGQLFESIAGSNPVASSPSSFQIGHSPMADGIFSYEPFNGVLDEVAVYSYSLSENQVSAHYAAAVPEPSTIIILVMGVAVLLIPALRRYRNCH